MAAASATRWSSPPESSAVERPAVADAQRQRRLLHAPGHGGGRVAQVLQGQRDLGPDRSHHHRCFGVLKQRPDMGGELAGTVLTRIQPRHHGPAGEPAAVKVRHQSADCAEQCGLP